MNTMTSSPKRFTPEMLCLLGITLIAFALRVWNIGYDLPRIYRGIEYIEVMRALELGMGQFNFNRIAKGGLFYLLFFEYGIFFVVLWFLGVVASPQDFAAYFMKDLTPFWIIGRMTSVLMGTASVVLVYLLGKKLFDAKVGLLAALFFALNPIHIEFSHYICVDIPMIMMSIAALYMMAFVSSDGTLKYYIATSLCVALAMLNKFPAVVLVVPFFIVHVARVRKEGKGFFGLLERRAIYSVLVFGLSYFVGAPGLIREPWRFLALFGLVSTPAEHADIYTGETPNLWLHYAGLLNDNLGPLLLAFLLFGLFYALYKGKLGDKYLAFFCLAFYTALCISRFREWSTHYLLPFFPPGLLVASRGIFVAKYAADKRKGLGNKILAIVLLLILAPLAYASVNQSLQFSRPNTRELAKIWIEENLPPGEKIFMYGFPGLTYSRIVQVNDLPSNLLRLADDAQLEGKKVKAKFFRIQAAEQKGLAYDLVTEHIRRTLMAPLEAYRKQNIRYIILDKNYFDEEEDTQYSKALNESRVQFYAELLADHKAKLVAHFDPSKSKSRGPYIEIFYVGSD